MSQLIDPSDPATLSKIASQEAQLNSQTKLTSQELSTEFQVPLADAAPAAAPASISMPAPAPVALSPLPVAAPQNDLDAKKLELIEQIKQSSSLDQLKNVMAVNALEGNDQLPKKLEPALAMPVPAPAPAPAPIMPSLTQFATASSKE